jgi:argininosuccinate lyase
MATMQDKQAWSGRFNEPVAELVKRYTASVDFDKRLALFDIQGSLAHAQMLASCGIISAQDLNDIQRGLAQIENEVISHIGWRRRQAPAYRPFAQ